ncbi:Hypothetical predicted protein [Cloeon dipterum]|uniref:Uncharacterized protein n=1 Tax=Cloeon dipterum TaxID=197152 RepID=A0A8S1BU08_9INSE|nr:Hypothetical predicted protein [Cloeon dipterum]
MEMERSPLTVKKLRSCVPPIGGYEYYVATRDYGSWKVEFVLLSPFDRSPARSKFLVRPVKTGKGDAGRMRWRRGGGGLVASGCRG